MSATMTAVCVETWCSDNPEIPWSVTTTEKGTRTQRNFATYSEMLTYLSEVWARLMPEPTLAPPVSSKPLRDSREAAPSMGWPRLDG